MDEDDRKRLTRRQALAAAGTLGAGAALAGGLVLGARDGGNKDGETATGPSDQPGGAASDKADAEGLPVACVLTPSMTEGPYFVDTRFDRPDIRGDQAGVPLKLRVNLLDVDDDCAPYPGAVVDVWQCNAQGVYSDVSDPASGETVEGTWLRGLQRTDDRGQAGFTTIFPGWYPGRTVHIHLKVRTFQGNATTYNFTSQLFFPEDLTRQVMEDVPAYSRPEPMTTTNANDGIFDPHLVLDLEGGTDRGFSTAIDIGLTGLPA